MEASRLAPVGSVGLGKSFPRIPLGGVIGAREKQRHLGGLPAFPAPEKEPEAATPKKRRLGGGASTVNQMIDDNGGCNNGFSGTISCAHNRQTILQCLKFIETCELKPVRVQRSL